LEELPFEDSDESILANISARKQHPAVGETEVRKTPNSSEDYHFHANRFIYAWKSHE
jgi:hypothetical protein